MADREKNISNYLLYLLENEQEKEIVKKISEDKDLESILKELIANKSGDE